MTLSHVATDASVPGVLWCSVAPMSSQLDRLQLIAEALANTLCMLYTSFGFGFGVCSSL